MRITKAIFVMLFISTLFVGCNIIPQLPNMIYDPPLSTFSSFGKSIFVSEAQDALANPGMPQSLFVEALKGSIEKSKLLEVVDQPTKADYHLLTAIVNYQIPTGGFDKTCRMTVRYILKRPSGTEPVWFEEIANVKTCGVKDAFAGGTRQRVTAEGAARENIQEALEKLSALKL